MRLRFPLLAIIVLAVMLVLPVAAQACAVCLTGIGQDDPVADAFNWSVLFLMAMPYTVVGSIAGWLFYNYRRAAGKRGTFRKKLPALHLAWIHKESGR